MKNLSKTVPEDLARLLRGYAARRRRQAFAARAAGALLLLLAMFLFSLLFDRCLDLPVVVRRAFLILTAAAPAATLVSAGASWFRWRDADRVAGEIDDAVPRSRDALRSALNFRSREDACPGTFDPYLLRAAVERASATAAGLSTAHLVVPGPARRRLAAAAALALAWVLASAVPASRMGLLLRRFVDPGGNHPRPAFTMIELNRALFESAVQGDDFALTARLYGRVPHRSQCTLHVETGGETRAMLMSPRPNARFESLLKEVQHPVRYYVTAGDGRTALHRVEVIPRPVITAMRAQYDYPRYTRLPRRREEVAHREFTGVEGTRVQVEIESSLPVRASRVEFPQRTYNIRWDRERRKGTFGFTVEHDTTFAVRLVADNGTGNPHEQPCRVRVLPDNPPTVSLQGLPEDPAVFPEDILNLRYSAGDDFGVGELFLRAYGGINRHEIREYSVPLADFGSRRIEGPFSVEVSELIEDDESAVGIELVAVDTKGQQTASPRFELSVISESADRQLDELADLQHRILNTRHWRYPPFREVGETLRRETGQLTILLDGMDEDTPLDGRRRDMFGRIQRALGSLYLMPLTHHTVEPLLFHTEYPYRSHRLAAWALCLPYLLEDPEVYQARLAEIADMERPFEALRDLLPRLETQARMAGDFVRALSDSLLENRLRLLSVLAEQAVELDARAAAAGAGEFRDRLLQQRRERQEKVGELSDTLEDGDVSRAARALSDAGARNAGSEAGSVRDAADALQAALQAGGWLDGRLGEAVEQSRQRHLRGDVLRRTLDEGGRDRVLRLLADLIRLRRASPVPEEALLFSLARVYEAVETEDPEREQAAMDAFERMSPWIVLHEMHERVRLLRLHLEELRIDVDVNRLQPGSPRTDAAWQHVREQLLALVRDARAGRFRWRAEEADAELKTLAALRARRDSLQAAVAEAETRGSDLERQRIAHDGEAAQRVREAQARHEVLEGAVREQEQELAAARAALEAAEKAALEAAQRAAAAAQARMDIEAEDRPDGEPDVPAEIADEPVEEETATPADAGVARDDGLAEPRRAVAQAERALNEARARLAEHRLESGEVSGRDAQRAEEIVTALATQRKASQQALAEAAALRPLLAEQDTLCAELDFQANVNERVASLAAFEPACRSWLSSFALASPSFAAQAGQAAETLAGLEILLRPRVEQGTRDALEGAGALWEDMRANVAREPARFQAEREAIPDEVAWGEERAKQLVAGTEEHRVWPWRKGSEPRLRTSREVSRRMLCRAAAATTLADLREWLWVMESAPGPDAGMRALERMAEYLAYLEEHVYDKVHSLHDNRSANTYPSYLLTLAQNYEDLEPVYLELHGWLASFAAGAPGDLESQARFREVLQKANRADRHARSLEAVEAYLDRAAGFDPDMQEAQRRGTFHALRDSPGAMAFWDRVYLAGADLTRLGQAALQALRGDPPRGLPDPRRRAVEEALARIAWLLPEGDRIPPEAEPLLACVSDGLRLVPRLAAASVSDDDGVGFLADEAEEWVGRLLGVMDGLGDLVTAPPPRIPVRRRYTGEARMDLRYAMGRIIRAERRWAERTANAVRGFDSRYARLLTGPAESSPAGADVAWAFSLAQRTRRKSAAAVSQRGRGLELEESGIDERFLNMPKYLYEELMRAARRPYPSQFKEPGLSYMRRLVDAAR